MIFKMGFGQFIVFFYSYAVVADSTGWSQLKPIDPISLLEELCNKSEKK
jgi:hypothetical protein